MNRILLAGLLLQIATSARAGLPDAPAAELKLDAAILNRIDDAANRAIVEKKVPGTVILVGRDGKIGFSRAYGDRAIEPSPEGMTRDTIFDLASLTKPIATATSILILIDCGKLRLDAKLGDLLPEFANHGKAGITVDQLLRHRAGFIPDNPMADYADGPEIAWKKLADLELASAPGVKFVYSDVGFEILGRIVERVSGESLEGFVTEKIIEPLGLTSTQYSADAACCDDVLMKLARRTAPTERGIPRGVVHDPRARALGGRAGHAGLFSTADDLAVYAQMILDGGKSRDGQAILKPDTVRAMLNPGTTFEHQKRGLGWDIATGYSSPRGAVFGPTSFGHTGFTGTSLWIDPETRTFVIILTSRLHPDGKSSSPSALRSAVATIVGEAITDRPVPSVSCGIDVLAAQDFTLLQGKKVGLVTNHTGRLRDGRTTIDALHKATGVTLAALFSPEHGIRGEVDKEVSDDRDPVTGVPIFSLYGKTRKPSRDSLIGLDVLVYDIQDIGTRFYTYISTLGLVLEAAAEARIPVIVLDRPNPIGGVEVSGPVRDQGLASFTAYHALPVRHGMTVGELARLFAAERKIPVDLTVIPCVGWRRVDLFDRTDLVWTNPSPNMRSLTEAVLYPGVGLLEATNLATGRGTDTPFERVGAPYIRPAAWAKSLNTLGLAGVRFVPIRFTPRERQFAGVECGGVQILLTNWEKFDPIDLGFGLAQTLRADYPDDWKPENMIKLLGNQKSFDVVKNGGKIEAIKASYQDELGTFRTIRAKYLLYP